MILSRTDKFNERFETESGALREHKNGDRKMESKQRILFVDDETKILQSLTRLLRKESDRWEMTFCSDPVSALQILRRTPQDVAVLDLNMPGIDGLTLLSKIKENEMTRDTEVILLTGLEDKNLKLKALDLNAVDLLNKPVTREELVARLSNALRLKKYKETLREKNRQLEKQLLEAQKLELVGILAAGATHDFKNILHAILGFNDLARGYIDKEDPAYNHLSRVHKIADHAQRVVMQILALTKNSGEAYNWLPLDIVVSDNLELLEATLRAGFTIESRIGEVDTEFLGNPVEIFQVMMNLCMNATHAMPEGGVITVALDQVEFLESIRTVRRELPPASYFVLSVSDTGTGMDEEVIAHLFDPMFTTKDAGFGLGLLVVNSIVDKNRGGIKVESFPGEGASFTIYLPVEPDPAMVASAEIIV